MREGLRRFFPILGIAQKVQKSFLFVPPNECSYSRCFVVIFDSDIVFDQSKNPTAAEVAAANRC
jgi:hypothetical protein